jgi:hypothetical protein
MTNAITAKIALVLANELTPLSRLFQLFGGTALLIHKDNSYIVSKYVLAYRL